MQTHLGFSCTWGPTCHDTHVDLSIGSKRLDPLNHFTGPDSNIFIHTVAKYHVLYVKDNFKKKKKYLHIV